MPDTAWTKEPPTSNGIYWWRADERDYEPDVHQIADGLVFRLESERSEPVANYGGEWLGPISPEDAERLVRLREVAEKALGYIQYDPFCTDHGKQIANDLHAALETTQ